MTLSEDSSSAGPGRASLSRRRAGGLVVLVVLVTLGAWWAARAGGPKGDSATRGARPVPVALAAAERRDVPIYLTGLGTVTASNTVTVRSRVDGQIVRVAFREGQEVRKGDLLLMVDPRPSEVALEQAQATMVRDQAQLADARRNLDRLADLQSDGIVAQQQLDTQRSTVQQLDAALRVDQAQIDDARLQLDYCRITAPIDGRVGLRLVDVGNYVRSADQNALLVITQLEPIAVVFTLPEDTLQTVAAQLHRGPLSAEARSRDDQAKLATGTLLTIDNQIDTSTGTARLKALFDNKNRALWPNQFVNVRLLVEVRKDRTVVPAAAIQRGPEGSFAYLMKADHTIEVRSVTVGVVQDGMAVADEGLRPGELVVVDGQEKVQAGTKVEPRQERTKPAAS